MLTPSSNQTSWKGCHCFRATLMPNGALLGITALARVTDTLAANFLEYFIFLSNFILSNFCRIHILLVTHLFHVFGDTILFLFVSYCPSHPISVSFEDFHLSVFPSLKPFILAVHSQHHPFPWPQLSFECCNSQILLMPSLLYLTACWTVNIPKTTLTIFFPKPAYKYFQCFPITLKMKSRFCMLFKNCSSYGPTSPAHDSDTLDSNHCD